MSWISPPVSAPPPPNWDWSSAKFMRLGRKTIQRIQNERDLPKVATHHHRRRRHSVRLLSDGGSAIHGSLPIKFFLLSIDC